MKILQVCNYLGPAYGGSAEVPRRLAAALAQNGHHVSIFTSDRGLDVPPALPGVEINAFKTVFDFAGFTYTPSISKQAAQSVGDFDVLHLHNFRTYQNIVACKYAKKYGKPYIIQPHGSLATFFQKGMMKKCYDALWGGRILRGAAKVLAVTGMEAEQCLQMGVSRDKIEIVPHGIDTAANTAAGGEFRRRFKIEAGRRIVLFLGRVNKIKGIDILVRAFAGLAGGRNGTLLVIAGPDDGYLGVIKKMAAELKLGDNILFTGPLYDEAKWQAYRDADVYVLPSNYEIFGITLLEALACGKPVITTDRCGLAAELKDKAALVVPYEAAPLQKALDRLLSGETLRKELGAYGRRLVEEKYTWTRIAAQVESIYRGVIG